MVPSLTTTKISISSQTFTSHVCVYLCIYFFIVKMPFCGPKLSLCGVVLSAWGIVQLSLMGIFFYIRSVALIEDLPLEVISGVYTGEESLF